MSRNSHFATKITAIQGKRILDCIDRAADIIYEKDYIPENDYPELMGDADNSPLLTGMPLNLMVINRQRCCILGDGLFAHRKGLKEAAEAAKTAGRKRGKGDVGTAAGAADGDVQAAKKQKVTKICSETSCMAVQETSQGWLKCDTKGCRKWFCPSCATEKRKAHYTVCQEAYVKKKEALKNKQ